MCGAPQAVSPSRSIPEGRRSAMLSAIRGGPASAALPIRLQPERGEASNALMQEIATTPSRSASLRGL